MSDTTGDLPFFLITAAIGAVVGSIIGGITAAKNGESIWAGIGIGAATEGLIGAGLGAITGVMLAGSATAGVASIVSGAGILATAVSTGGAGAGLALVADNISRAVNNVGTVLYSGGEQARQAATTFANNTGGTTIDPTVIGQSCRCCYKSSRSRLYNCVVAGFRCILPSSKWCSKCICFKQCLSWEQIVSFGVSKCLRF